MPSAFALFRSGANGSRRSSIASSQDAAQSEGAQPTERNLPQSVGKSQPASRFSASAQRGVPPIETSQSALNGYKTVEDATRRSDSFPSIDIISPTGSNQRRVWGPGISQDDEGRGEAAQDSAGGIASLGSIVSHDSSSFSEERTPIAGDFRDVSSGRMGDSSEKPPDVDQVANSDDDDDDPLFSLAKPVARKPTRSNAGTSIKRSAKGETPDRHDIMRRAIAESTSSSISSGMKVADPSQAQQGKAKPSGVRTTGQGESDLKNSALQTHSNTGSSSTFIDHEAPGEGSLSIQDFAGKPKDSMSQDQDKTNTSTTRSSPPDSEAKKSRMFPKRPKMGSRANSFTSEMSTDQHDQTSLDHSQSAKSSPEKIKKPGKSASGGNGADPVRGKHSSLAVPGVHSALDAASTSADSRHRMHESASTSSLLGSPLHRFRRPSDAGSPAPGKRGKSPASGIAGAIAASGMAGLGVGNADLLRHSQQALAAEAQAAHKSTSPRPRSSSNVYREYVGPSQGGIYRDPVTGKIVERGPDGRAGEGIDMSRNRSGTGNSSISLEGSDISTGSGLSAAADFARTLQQHQSVDGNDGFIASPMLGEDVARSLSADRAHQLTPNGIGAVGGLSPSGLGERVELGVEDEPWHASDVDAQITGFAVASSKRNADFHALFPSVPEDDYLIEDYGCALVREILIQGRLYVSENHVCFHANIFGWVTSIVVSFGDIVAIEKRMTAYVIPNAIQVATLHSKHTFASFLSRDTTYDVVVNIWKLSHPTLPTNETQLEGESDDESAEGGVADGAGAKAKQDQGLDASTTTPAKKSKRKMIKKRLGIKNANGSHGVAAAIAAPELAAAIGRGKSPAPANSKKSAHRKTECPCEKDKKHFPTVVLDTTFPTVPEKLYNLLFTSGFMKGFWTDNQKLLELQMSDWAPNANNNNILSRDISYIKPLTGSFGPKQTKCLLTDENEHVDFDEYVTTMTTTRTPEVPSGNSFSVKTRTCITWAGGNVSRIYVTCTVEWTGRSMVKGIIDRASIDGQKQYYKDLDGAIRSYIKEHASEFREEGEDPDETAAAVDEALSQEKSEADGGVSEAVEEKEGLVKYMGMAGNAGSAVFDMGTAAVETLSDLLGGASPKAIILGFIVFLLVVGNLFALRGGSGRDPVDPHRLRNAAQHHVSNSLHDLGQHGREAAASAEAVAHAVRDVLKDYFEPHGRSADMHKYMHTAKSADPAHEIAELLGVLDEVEKRVSALRNTLRQVDPAAAGQTGSVAANA